MDQATGVPRWFHEHAAARLDLLYGDQSARTLERLAERLVAHGIRAEGPVVPVWTERDAILITYGDSIRCPGEAPLATLHRFLGRHLTGVIDNVHVLPFTPYSSDDGFAVIDYQRVNPELGDWDDLRRLASEFNLMADLVINHVSRENLWFIDYLRDEPPGRDFFIEVDPAATDLTAVTRPRSQPLLSPVYLREGTRWVWTTFSKDQVDVNFANPDVLLAYVDIMLRYVETGARFIRLDAIAFLWKRPGTRCIHLRETHEVVKLLREILAVVAPGAVLITETNVPNGENLSYFGNSDEAHMVYNFTLPPLLLHALLFGNSTYLMRWLQDMPRPPRDCTYLNFTASHDGIGLRPTEDLLTPEEVESLIDTTHEFGAYVSMKSNGDGTESPYEINVSLFDALAGTIHGRDQWQLPRFLCSQTIMLALQGIPALYIHSLTATPNDRRGVEQTGRTRAINRHKWDYDTLGALLENPMTPNAQVFGALRRLLEIRRRQPAFHPDATQETLPLGEACFGVLRSAGGGQRIFALSNLTPVPQPVDISEHKRFEADRPWYDLIAARPVNTGGTMLLQPYQSIWLAS